ncbi:Ig-like domain-containing protein, partial [Escherichia coli]|nr:Ig-like domain-containing protein [Escherichia coli]
QNGLVTGKAVGSANITFTTNDGAKKATKSVTINSAG